jgi:hypothetical protein
LAGGIIGHPSFGAAEASFGDRLLADLLALQAAHDAARGEDQHPAADCGQLFVVGACAKHDGALRCGGADMFEHRLPGADIHALGRLVEQNELRALLEPFAQHDLLLVAAAQRRHGQRRVRRPHLEGGADGARAPDHRPAVQQPGAEDRSQHGHGDVVADRQDADGAGIGAIAGDEDDPAADRRLRRDAGQRDAAPAQAQRAALGTPGAVEEVADLVIARTDQAGEADDLPLPGCHGKTPHAAAGQIADDDMVGTTRERSGRRRHGQTPTDDGLDEILPRGGVAVEPRGDRAVPQDRRPVGDVHHLIHVM